MRPPLLTGALYPHSVKYSRLGETHAVKVSLHPHHPCQAAMGVTDRLTAQNQDHHGKAGRMSEHRGDGPDWRRNTDLNSRLSF